MTERARLLAIRKYLKKISGEIYEEDTLAPEVYDKLIEMMELLTEVTDAMNNCTASSAYDNDDWSPNDDIT